MGVLHAQLRRLLVHPRDEGVRAAVCGVGQQIGAVVGAAGEQTAEQVADGDRLADVVADLVAARRRDHAVFHRQRLVHAAAEHLVGADRRHQLRQRCRGKRRIDVVFIDKGLVFDIPDRRRADAVGVRHAVLGTAAERHRLPRRCGGQHETGKGQKERRGAQYPFFHSVPSLSK